MSRKNYWRVAAVDMARAALERGPLVRPRKGHYHSGAKFFAHKTVNKLVENGEAVRVGTGVIHAKYLRKETREGP